MPRYNDPRGKSPPLGETQERGGRSGEIIFRQSQSSPRARARTWNRLGIKTKSFQPFAAVLPRASYHDGIERERESPNVGKRAPWTSSSSRPAGHSRIREDPNLLGGSHLFSGSSQSVTRSRCCSSLSPIPVTSAHTLYTRETHCNFKRLALRAFGSFRLFGAPSAPLPSPSLLRVLLI